jgi:hypothetical protein
MMSVKNGARASYVGIYFYSIAMTLVTMYAFYALV